MKTKMKYVILILLSMYIISCKNYLPTNKENKIKYVVKSIDEWSEKTCLYNLETGKSYISYNNDITINDTIGKFNIGDTVFLTLNK